MVALDLPTKVEKSMCISVTFAFPYSGQVSSSAWKHVWLLDIKYRMMSNNQNTQVFWSKGVKMGILRGCSLVLITELFKLPRWSDLKSAMRCIYLLLYSDTGYKEPQLMGKTSSQHLISESIINMLLTFIPKSKWNHPPFAPLSHL